MTTILVSVLKISLGASIIALAVMLVRLFLINKPKVYSYALWAAVLLRLLCPFSLEIEADIPTYNDIFAGVEESAQLAKQPNYNLSPENDQPGSSMQDFSSNSNVAYGESAPQNGEYPEAPDSDDPFVQQVTQERQQNEELRSRLLPVLLSVSWFLGIATVLGSAVISYLPLFKQMQTAICLGGNVYESDRIVSAFVLGFAKPKIYLPKGLSDNHRKIIIRHEKTHISRGDHIIKLLFYCLLAFHWFNPILWLSYSLMCIDIEKSCDEAVLKKLGEKNDLAKAKKAYGNALLAVAQKENSLALVTFSEGNVRDRIMSVLKLRFEKLSRKTIAIIASAAAAVVLIFCVTMLTSGNITAEQRGNSASVAATQAAFAADDEKVYYISEEKSGESVFTSLMRLDTETGGVQQLAKYENRAVSSMNISPDGVYYLLDDAIVFFDESIGAQKNVYSSGKSVSGLCLVDGVLYFISDSSAVISLDPQNGEPTELYRSKQGDVLLSLSVSLGKLCFIADNETVNYDRLLLIDTEKKTFSEIAAKSRIYRCIMQGEHIYYSCVDSYNAQYSDKVQAKTPQTMLRRINTRSGEDVFLCRLDETKEFFVDSGTVYLPKPKGEFLPLNEKYREIEEAYAISFKFDTYIESFKAVCPQGALVMKEIDDESSVFLFRLASGEEYLLENAVDTSLLISKSNDSENHIFEGSFIGEYAPEGENYSLRYERDYYYTIDAFYDPMYVEQHMYGSRYSIDDYEKAVIITGWGGEPVDVVIPEFINGLPVIMIHSAFMDCATLKTLTIPDGVRNIVEGTFSGCTSLARVNIPADCIQGTYELYRIFPSNKNLEIIDNRDPKGVDIYSFTDDPSSLNKVKVPNGTTHIRHSGFEIMGTATACSLREITMPGSVVSIGNNAFSQCLELKKVTFSKNTSYIGASAFSNCEKLEEIVLPDKVESIHQYCFADCRSLSKVELPDELVRIGKDAFLLCTSLEDITIPSGVRYIGSNAFSHCSSLRSVTFLGSVSNIMIDGGAFEGCHDSLVFLDAQGNVICTAEDIYRISASVENDDEGVSYYTPVSGEYTLAYIIRNANGIDSTIPDIVKVEGYYAEIIGYSGEPTKLIVPNQLDDCPVYAIGQKAFSGCKTLMDVTLPSSVRYIGRQAFCGSSIRSIELSEQLCFIDEDAFAECENLVFRCKENSYAHRWAQEHGFDYEII